MWTMLFISVGLISYFKSSHISVSKTTGLSLIFIGVIQLIEVVFGIELVPRTHLSFIYGMVVFAFPIFILKQQHIKGTSDVITLLAMLGFTLWEMSHLLYYLWDTYLFTPPPNIDSGMNIMFFVLILIGNIKGGVHGCHVKRLTYTWYAKFSNLLNHSGWKGC